MIHVVATIQVQPGRREEFLAIFRTILSDVRAEQGCVEYGPAVDVDADLAAQPGIRPDVVTVLEKWESLEALRAHLAAPHMVQYKEKVRDLVENVVLHILEPA